MQPYHRLAPITSITVDFVINTDISPNGDAPTPLIQYNCVLRENNTLHITN